MLQTKKLTKSCSTKSLLKSIFDEPGAIIYSTIY